MIRVGCEGDRLTRALRREGCLSTSAGHERFSEPRASGAVKKTYCRVGARERQAHAKLSAAERRPCRNRNFCASTPD